MTASAFGESDRRVRTRSLVRRGVRERIASGLAFVLVACGESPVESVNVFPAGVTGELVYDVSWRDGSTRHDEFRIMDARGRNRTVYSTQGGIIEALALAPDGQHIAFREVPDTPNNCCLPSLYGIAFGDDTAAQMFPHSNLGSEQSPHYSATGRLAYQAVGRVPEISGIFIDSVFAFRG